jgi:hypothetical protein
VTGQHNFAHARVLTSGDAQFNSAAGNVSVYENCTFSRGPEAEEGSGRAQGEFRLRCMTLSCDPVADWFTEDKLFQRICKWLGDINFNSIYTESLAKGTEGTGMWFIKTEKFRRWAEGDLQILWGTGKREPFGFRSKS